MESSTAAVSDSAADARTARTAGDEPLLPRVEEPKGFFWKMSYYFMRKKFGKVMTPASVFSVRMPLGFTTYYGKIGKLDKKLELPADLAVLVREQVASTNRCLFCMDTNKATIVEKVEGGSAKVDALGDYQTSPLFSEAERAALDYVTEVTATKAVRPETFERVRKHYGEREICDLVWLVSSEHLYNINNIALNIGSDGFCDAALANSRKH